MIRVSGLCKEYRGEGKTHRVLSNVSLTVNRGEKVAVLGRNGAGKSTLMRLIGGVEVPTSGQIEREMSISWPLGLQGGFQGSLTGNDNMRFIARIYNKPFDYIRAYVDDFAELGQLFPKKPGAIPDPERLSMAQTVGRFLMATRPLKGGFGYRSE